MHASSSCEYIRSFSRSSEGDVDERVVPVLVVKREALVEPFRRACAPGVGKLDHRERELGAHAGAADLLGGDLGKVVHVRKAGDAGADHLGEREAGAVADELLVHPLRLQRPDLLAQPGLQRGIFAGTSEERHGGMPVGVDEAGQQHVALEADAALRGVARVHLRHAAEPRNAPVCERHGGVGQHRVGTVHGQDPGCGDQQIDRLSGGVLRHRQSIAEASKIELRRSRSW
jgi:hypothetical protein